MAAMAATAPAARAQEQLQPNFHESTLPWTGLNTPTAVRFAPAPDPRIFVAEKEGVIKEFDSVSDTTATVVADLSSNVMSYLDRGMVGLAIDPAFPISPYLYVTYTYGKPLNPSQPTWVGAQCDTPPGATTDGCVVSGRLSRIQIDPLTNTMVPGSETVLINDWCQQFPSHSVDDIAFGPDGALYASAGEGSNFNTPDYGQFGGSLPDTPTPKNPCGDPPAGVGGDEAPPTTEGGSLRAQDLRTMSDPAGLDGSLIRIDPATGAGMPDNPLHASSDPNARRIVAYGMRNPFRFAFRPGTNEVWIGDVGLSAFEEVDRVTNPADSTADNFGWPCWEGPGHHTSFDSYDVDICENLYAQSGSTTPPYYYYRHDQKVVSGEPCPPNPPGTAVSSAISGITFYKGGNYPAEYDDALFFTDYARACIWVMERGANGLPDSTKIKTFASDAALPVDLQIGPNGDLFYAGLDNTIRRINYTGPGNQQPNAVANATPTAGPVPLDVGFDATSSNDPDPGDTLTYEWDLDGDGQYDDSTAAKPHKIYSQVGNVTVGLRVTDGDGATDTDSITISPGNSPPVASIDSPDPGSKWSVGDKIQFSGSATDLQDVTLPDSAYTWSVIIRHCPSDCHTHLLSSSFPHKPTGSFFAPDHEYPSHLELTLKVTDSGGLTGTKTIELDPNTVDLNLKSAPAGLVLSLNAVNLPAPFTRPVIAGSNNTISAATPQTLAGGSYTFRSWFNGGARTHIFKAPLAGVSTLTATFDGPQVGGQGGDKTKPVLSHLSMTHRRFAVDRRFGESAAVSARHRRGKRGTAFRFKLSESAEVIYRIERRRAGRRLGGACVPPRRALRLRPRCTRHLLKGEFDRTGAVGSNRQGFTGMLGPAPLAPGTYRATLHAHDAAGNSSTTRRITFKVVRP